MFKADDFRQYAKECFEYARVSDSEEARAHFLDMAKAWIVAAVQIEKDCSEVWPLAPFPDTKNTVH